MEFAEHLKSSVDIVKVIGEYVRLRKSGAGPRWTGLCPFHTEKTPSFSVHQAHQFYKCFGCGAGGDVIKFVMEVERLSFFEALKLLADRNGIPMPKRAEYADEETRLRAALFEMHEIAARAFQSHLNGPAGAAAREYLVRRSVSGAAAEEFGLGYSDRSGQDLVRRFERAGMTAPLMEASGLVLKRQDGSGFFDRFRNRLMFPIHSETGKVIGFGGRALGPEDEPKYLNSPETPVYRKSQVLYNLHRAKEGIRKGDLGILVEGYMDVIGLHSNGVRQSVASCGTALTLAQVRALKRHSEKVVVNFDPDAAGSSAAERSIHMLLEEGMQVRVLELEGGRDPDEYVKTSGVEAYLSALGRAPGYFHWLADRARGRYDMRNAQGRVSALQLLLPAIQRVGDKLERAAIAADLAGYLGVEPGLVLDHFKKAAAERRERPTAAAAAQPVRPVEKILLNSLLLNSGIRGRIVPRLREMPEVAGFTSARIFRLLFTLYDQNPQFRFADLEARLEEAERQLLSSLALADETREEDCTLEQAEACLTRLEEESLGAGKAALRQRVKEAERSGDLSEAMRLARELAELEKSRN
ncbi:MAG: DNA primase [Bryobacterales bacterium]|nr:DNA primase [Bryobacterales bacterium]